MLVQKTYRHPLHYVNSVRAAIKKELKKVIPSPFRQYPVPALFREYRYYFCFELHQDIQESEVRWGIVVFDSKGMQCFTDKGKMYVSLWRWQRQGIARTTQMIESTIKNAFSRRGWPLHSTDPFYRVSEGIYEVNINWPKYQDYKPVI